MFKVWDKVVCVNAADSGDSLVSGKTYTIGDVQEGYIVLEEDENGYAWMASRFQLVSEVDPLVEIRQSEYDELIEEINLLQELLSEANQKLAGLESKPSEEFKPVSEYTMEDWEQARDEKWVFELNEGTEVFVKGIMDEFDDKDHPIELSLVTNNLHECTVTERGHFWSNSPSNQRSIKRRIK